MENRKGMVTIPSDKDFVEGTKRIGELWGADAIRDCDGTDLPAYPHDLAEKVYKTYFIVRGDNAWAEKHPEESIRAFLPSERLTAMSSHLEIEVGKGYLKDQVVPDFESISYWQVFDRTAQKEVKGWSYDEERGLVILSGVTPYHVYSVDFMAKIVWHPVQIYNYLTNGWTVPKQKTYDPACPKTAEYIKEHMEEWCKENPDIDVVRFTTFLYQFSLFFNDKGKEKYVDWFGYGLTANPSLLKAFENESGISLTAEDFIQNGTGNNPFQIPNPKFVAYQDFVSRFVSKTIRGLVDIVHRHGKEAMMFLGDDWIGSEPYGPHFKDMNLDAVVGSVGGGVTVRMLAEIPGVKIHEGRFLPYFFPDTFFEGNEENAVKELNKNWNTARRALLRKPLDRMGYGGYLSLADRFPKFIERVGQICEEFRQIHDACIGEDPYSVATVAILNAWGRERSWMGHMVAHELWYQQIYSYQGVYEALSGLPVKVKFLSFDEVKRGGIPEDVDVLINVGDRDTAYSGGPYWKDPEIQEKVREFVAKGKGFIGVGEPTAYLQQGRLFTLSDVLGVDEEVSLTLSEDKYNIEKKPHFIVEDISSPIDYGEGKKNVYALEGADVLDIRFSSCFERKVNVGEVLMAAHSFGDGRSVYIAGLPYSPQNARLLYRSILWASGKEDQIHYCFSSNIETEAHYYPGVKRYAVVNNSPKEEETVFYSRQEIGKKMRLRGGEIRWVNEDE